MTWGKALADGLSVLLCLNGAFFFTVGTVGLLRLPDFYSRTHAAAKCDTLGAGSILLGLALHAGFEGDGLKIAAMAVFILLSSPTTAHALARAAFRTGLEPWRRQNDAAKEGE